MIVADGLGFAYPDGPELFGGLDVTVESGQVVALTGASGRGKSTLLYVFGLLLRPGAGRVAIDGRSTTELDDAELSWLRANRMGFVFQDAALDPTRTVLDNVTEVAVYRGQPRATFIDRARELLAQTGVQVRAGARPTQVSGGQAARIGLCRALVGDPSVVLADEPTGNLDLVSAGQVLDGLDAAARGGASVLIATHDPRVIERCHHAVDLDRS